MQKNHRNWSNGIVPYFKSYKFENVLENGKNAGKVRETSEKFVSQWKPCESSNINIYSNSIPLMPSGFQKKIRFRGVQMALLMPVNFTVDS